MTNEYLNKFERPNLIRQSGEWFDRHMSAVTNPRPGFESVIAQLLSGWLRYADEHKRRYESGIGADYVLGAEWVKIGSGLLGLLNGETGRFDCGVLDMLVRGVIASEGFNPEDY